MSLMGDLEELGLGEILQLISLSRKTGVLSLHGKGREGAIVFKHGLVVKALSSAYKMGLWDVLIRKGVIDQETLDKAMALQQKSGGREYLGDILASRFKVSPEAIEVVVREQIERIVLSLFAWKEGTFDFEVQAEIDAMAAGIADPLHFVLSQGLNPQFLAMEGELAAGDGHADPKTDHEGEGDGETGDVEITRDLSDEASTQAGTHEQAALRPLVIVDDDGATLQALSGMLRESGYEIHAMTSSENALILVDSLCRTGRHPVLLVDLIMPRMDGSGVLGGIELVELLHNNFEGIPILAMTDYHNSDAEKKIGDMGYGCVLKPRRADCASPERVRSFLPSLLAGLRRSVACP